MLTSLALAATLATCPVGRECISFTGTLSRGKEMSRPFGPGLVFALRPIDTGWEIVVRDERPNVNIARLTPPLHVFPHPRYLEGSHFRNADNSGPNDGSVNAPQKERDFIFSPKVGRSIDVNEPATVEQVRQIEREGRGRLIVSSLELGNLERGKKAHIQRMAFRVSLSWPSAWAKRPRK